MIEQLVDALAADCGNREYINALGTKFLAQLFDRGFFKIVNRVGFVGCDHLGLSGKLLAVIGKLCVDRIDVRDRVASFCSGCIDNVDEHLGTLDMAQKFMAETDAFRSALDQSRNVCDDEALHIRQIDNSEVRI